MNYEGAVRELDIPRSCRPVQSGLYLENRIRYVAQSILTGIVHKPELPSLNEAQDIISWAQSGVHDA